MNNRLLIRSSGDYADEYDLEGFCLVDSDTWDNIVEGIPEGSFEAYFGTNESCYFDNKEDYLSHLEIIPITKEDEETLIRLLNLKVGYPSEKRIFTYGLFVINSENW